MTEERRDGCKPILSEVTGAAGAQLGRYRIVRLIGQGGMGAVYEAVRTDDFHKRVAVKIVKSAFDSAAARERFQRERQVLAALEHPYIARLLDGGHTDDGRPYLALEYVEGTTINRFCGRLDRGARLELFLKVCEAVDYAHRKLVVHRDLKPGNIMVTADGTPKLLDFGIAKLLEGEVSAESTVQQPMTPEYASPEQVRSGAISTATDVYSLGVLLYELLTGRKPYEFQMASALEFDRVICGQAPAAPGLGRDLDAIVLTALRKEPERRYPSAAKFAEDIERYLTNRPVLARPDTLGYRARKFVARNGFALAGTAVLGVTMAAGVAATIYQARIAQRRFDQVRELANSFLFQVDDSIAKLNGSTEARELIVKTGMKYLDILAADARWDTALKLELAGAYEKLADVQGNPASANLGHSEESLVSYGKARKLAEEVIAAEPRNAKARRALAGAVLKASTLHRLSGNTAAARDAIGAANAALASLRAEGQSDAGIERLTGAAYVQLGDVYGAGQRPEALGMYREAVACFERAQQMAPSARHQRARQIALTRVGRTVLVDGNAAGALPYLEKSLGIAREVAAADPNNQEYRRSLANALSAMGDVEGLPAYMNLGRTTEAMRHYREAQAIFEELERRDPKSVLVPTDQLFLGNRIAALLLATDREAAVGVLMANLKLKERLGDAVKRPDVQAGFAVTHERMALAYLGLGRIEGGQKEVDAALGLAQDPDMRMRLYLIRGDLRKATGDEAGAKAAWGEAGRFARTMDAEAAPAMDLSGAADVLARLAEAGVDRCENARQATALLRACQRRGAPARAVEGRLAGAGRWAECGVK